MHMYICIYIYVRVCCVCISIYVYISVYFEKMPMLIVLYYSTIQVVESIKNLKYMLHELNSYQLKIQI